MIFTPKLFKYKLSGRSKKITTIKTLPNKTDRTINYPYNQQLDYYQSQTISSRRIPTTNIILFK